MTDFTHLHVHTEYSLLDGATMIKPLMERTKELGMTSIACTDHGVMYGIIEFFCAAKDMGIKPLLGCECYMSPRTRFDKDVAFDKSPSHLTLIAKNMTGYKNLIKMVSLANLEGFFYKPRIDEQLLKQYSEGLVCLSGCMSGSINRALLAGNYEKALETATNFKTLFGDDYYLEVQHQQLEGQDMLLARMSDISKKLKIPLIATNDVHYLRKEDAQVQDILIALQTGKTLKDKERLHFDTQEFYLKSGDEMLANFTAFPESLSISMEIADKCNVELELGKPFLPEFKVPQKETPDSFLKLVAYEGLQKRYPVITTAVQERFDFELSVIQKMGFSSYFLIVSDFVKFAKDNGISVGPGRGSAAGSIVAYALRITNIDPLKFFLFFERFLNPERKSMPDIDIDFCIENRQKVIDYTKEKYGHDHVAQIVTFGRMAARMAIRDVGRVLEVPLADVDKVAKLIPMGMTLKEALEESPELKGLQQSSPEISNLLHVAAKLEGIARHTGIHAAGVVIAKDPLTDTVPIFEKDGQNVTMFPKDDLELTGLLKMDFLGLRNLTMIAKALSLIKVSRGIDLDIENLPLDDHETYVSLSKGDSVGVFQLESQGMQVLLRALQPNVFEDIIALIALYRPGPLGSGMDKDFVNRKHGREKISYPLPQLESVLKDTYGTILYQEQVMQIAAIVAGFTMSDADNLRKAMGKKIPEVMAKMQKKFVEGAIANDIPEKKAVALFDTMAKFAEYGFNKSHSAAYAFITYQTAYLKTHYPVEYMAALISSTIRDSDKVSQYIAESKSLGIDILPPNINESLHEFRIMDNKILFGMGAIMNVGENAIEAIIKTREETGIFHSLADFCSRVDLRVVNRRVMESLIKSGAFDVIGKRKALLGILEDTHNEASKTQKAMAKGQLSLFGMEEQATIAHDRILSDEEFSDKELLRLEKEMLGLYISGHPLLEYMPAPADCVTVEQVSAMEQGGKVKVLGLLTNLKKRYTKAKLPMLTGTIEDLTGTIDFVVFPRPYEKNEAFLLEDKPILISGNADNRMDQMQISIDQVNDVQQPKGPKKPEPLILSPIPEKIEDVRTILTEHKGKLPVYLDVEGYKILLSENYWVSAEALPTLKTKLAQFVMG